MHICNATKRLSIEIETVVRDSRCAKRVQLLMLHAVKQTLLLRHNIPTVRVWMLTDFPDVVVFGDDELRDFVVRAFVFFAFGSIRFAFAHWWSFIVGMIGVIEDLTEINIRTVIAGVL